MKKILYLLICVILFSCSKDKNNPDPSQSISGSISYKVNGEIMSMNNDNLSSGEGVAFAKQLKGTGLQATRYLLNAQKGVNNVMISAITTDSLHTQSYHYDSTFIDGNFTLFTISFNGEISQVHYNTDYFDFNITSYKDGRISGNFTAKMTPQSGLLDYKNRGSVVITEGKLNNVPVLY